jgi:hypothetical protein
MELYLVHILYFIYCTVLIVLHILYCTYCSVLIIIVQAQLLRGLVTKNFEPENSRS